MDSTPKKNLKRRSLKQKKQKTLKNELLSFHLCDVVILSWSAAILTLNYVTIPGVPQKNIDPTFIASVFTGTLATFGVVPAKKDKKEDKPQEEKKEKVD